MSPWRTADVSPANPASARRYRVVSVLAVAAMAVSGLVVWSTQDVQRTLQARAQSALDEAGLAAQVQLHGRDAVIVGAAASEDASRAAAVVAGVSGIRRVTSAAATPTTTSPPTVAAPRPSPSSPPDRLPTTAPGGDAAESLRGAKVLRFATDEARLSRRGKDKLQRVAGYLRTHPRRQVRIQGFTDATGDEAGNLDLSRRRALAVAEHLERLGVEPKRLVVEAYGSVRPAADNRTPEGRAANRRVELVFEKVA